MTTWHATRKEVADRLAAAGIVPAEAEARFLVERTSGYDGDEWLDVAELEPPTRAAAWLEEMVERRIAGEPLQYVLGAWGFRGLDLMVDPRVLIPRPETETLVEIALEEAVRLGLRRSKRRLTLVEPEPKGIVVDLGTGSGAIGIALEAELPDVEVWCTDESAEALAVARANVAGCAATRVRVAEPGLWLDALPDALRGRLSLVVSNPPYIAEHEFAELPEEVARYEPRRALIAGPQGTEHLEAILGDALEWVMHGASVVLELAPHQAGAMHAYALELGYEHVLVQDDLAGRPRVLIARAK